MALGSHMKADDAIFTNFADFFVEEKYWEEAKSKLIKTGDTTFLNKFKEKFKFTT